RLFLRALAGVLTLRIADRVRSQDGLDQEAAELARPHRPIIALLLGFIGLAASFAGIIAFLGDRQVPDPVSAVGRAPQRGDVKPTSNNEAASGSEAAGKSASTQTAIQAAGLSSPASGTNSSTVAA